MSTSGTYTQTHTIVDIRRVVDCFAADYDMIAQATGLETDRRVTDTIYDVKLLAEKGYIERVDIVLQDANGKEIRAAKYVVSTSATWATERPGNNLWPSISEGNLLVVVSYSQAWQNLGSQAQEAFKQNNLKLTWSAAKVNLAYPALSGQIDRHYASNGYGMERTTYR
jgi:Bacterial HORMA domain family 1